MSAFLQAPIPGYSPWPQARQDTPFLQAPGAQGLQEGIAGGQQAAFTPTSEFFQGGTEGTAPPSSIPPQGMGGPGMWSRFGGQGDAPSSFAGNQGDVFGTGNIPALMQALMGGSQ